MGQQDDLEPAGLLVVIPTFKRAHLHTPPQTIIGPGGGATYIALTALAGRGQQPLNRSAAHIKTRARTVGSSCKWP